MDGQRDRSTALGGGQDSRAVAARGMGHQLARLPAAEVRQALDERFKRIIRYCQQDQLGALDDLLHLQHRHARQQHLRALARVLGDGVDADDLVLHRSQRAAQDRTDASRGDDADAQPARPARGRARAPAATAAGTRAVKVTHGPDALMSAPGGRGFGAAPAGRLAWDA